MGIDGSSTAGCVHNFGIGLFRNPTILILEQSTNLTMPTLKEAIVKAKKNAKKDKADKGKKAKSKSSGKSKTPSRGKTTSQRFLGGCIEFKF